MRGVFVILCEAVCNTCMRIKGSNFSLPLIQFHHKLPTGPVTCIDVFGEMEWVVTGSEDRTIAIWKL